MLCSDGSRNYCLNKAISLSCLKSRLRRWWPVPCTQMPAFAGQWGGTRTPVSDRLSETTLGLPFFRDLSAEDVARVVDALGPIVSDPR